MTTIHNQQEPTGFEIAVIGMACRFPGAQDIESFWQNLEQGVESITFFSEQELAAHGVDETLLRDPRYVPARGVIDDRCRFDHEFFDINPLEAEILDPQVRLFLQCCCHALEDASIVASQWRRPIGLYAGAGGALLWEAYQLLSPKTGTLGSFASSLLRKDYLCSKTSYKLGLNGPAVSIQTACSTSLVAIHLACQGLIGGECDAALAGGVSLNHEGAVGYIYQEGMIGSPDGHCRAFDSKAAGTVPGEGAGVVALERLSDAIEDHHHIYALIKGSAINNDGDRKVGFTAPSVAGQAEVIQNALAMAAVSADSIGYIEAHGTGTPLGDPVELAALKKVFPPKNGIACPLGSVKTNTGHLDAAAGVAGFIKTALCLYHRQLPPSLHVTTPNPALEIDDSRFFINTSLRSWQDSLHPRRAGVSAFGIGGTNAHAILEEYIVAPVAEPTDTPPRHHLLLLSAKTESALEAMSSRLAQFFIRHRQTDIEAAAYTLQAGRRHFHYRTAVAAASTEEAAALLSGASSSSSRASTSSPAIIFMFPGQGAQYTAMGRDLYLCEPVFRHTLDRCFDILERETDIHFHEFLRLESSDRGQAIPGTHIAQPLLVSFQYAMASLLRHWGVVPVAMTGHSIGQYTAACLSGVMSLEECLRLTAHRGRLMQSLPAGAMLAVPLPEEELLPLLSRSISPAAVNSPNRCVVSGPEDGIDELSLQLKNRGIDSTRLHTSHAFHSYMMDPILADFTRLAESVAFKQPAIPFISNLTGTWITGSEAADPRAWASHLRRPVRFADGIATLSRLEQPIFMDIGPGKTLASFARQHPDTGPESTIIQCSPHPRQKVPDRRFLLESIGSLWRQGIAIDWEAFNHHRPRKLISLPGYPFAQTEFPAHIDFSTIQIPESRTPAAQTSPPTPSKPPTASKQTAGAPPQSEIESIIISTFESFFAVSPITVAHDFYDLGGDSLSAVQLADLIQKRGIDVNFRQLLIHPTIADFCHSIQPSTPPPSRTTIKPIELSNLTEQLTQILKQADPSTTYNISPVQRFALEARTPGLPTDFILFQQDVSLPQDSECMNGTLSAIIAGNPLMRSLIVLDGNDYKIAEYDTFPNFEIPLIDLSLLNPDQKEERLHTLFRQLRQPIDVFAHVLFRPLLLKLQPDLLRLVIAFHHLIFDGASISVLEDQQQVPKTTYRHYVEFLEGLDYSEVKLEDHIDLFRYSSAIEASRESFDLGSQTIDELELDLAIIPTPFRHAYEDILLLAFGQLIRRFTGCPEAPIAQVSNGRVYAAARFTDSAGDFHDVIPLLLPDPAATSIEAELDRLRDYRRFIKDQNLNFLNYLLKHKSEVPDLQHLLSPFGFNAVPTTIDNVRRARALQPNLPIQPSQPTQPDISLQLYEDLHHQRLFIVFIHNSRRPLQQEFQDIISAIVQQLNGPLPR